ncbi:translocation/assembly module TamB [Buchnera aphidicola]|uniref:translocation/assembly module TamB n=1 Tax=Buchnera aphidicola TaxID=9 RepID=UPI003CE4A862
MNICQRFLFKSLMFFSIFFVAFILLLETNLGFKWFFNLSNHFFIKLKVEKISGNWRDFLLKNIEYDRLNYSMKANSVHIKLDAKSLFNMLIVFKDIQINHLVVLSKHNISNDFSKKKIFHNIIKKNIFIKFPLIFQKIHIDNLLFKSSRFNILFLNILTSIKFMNNDVIFSPSYIDNINVKEPNFQSSRIIFKPHHVTQKFNTIKELKYLKKIYRFLKYYSKTSPIHIPLNIDLKYVECKKIQIINNKNIGLLQLKLQAKIKNDILSIKTANIKSDIFQIKSFGKIIFHNNSSISSIINNKIIIPKISNKNINILFKSYLNKSFIFTLKSKNLYKLNMHGSIFFNNVNEPFNLKLDIQNLFWPIKKKYFLKFMNLHACVKGQINHYFISFQNIFALKGLPSILLNLKGQGSLENIFLKKVQLFPVDIHNNNTNIKSIINRQKYNKNILELIGKMNILAKIHNNIKHLYIPNIDLNLAFMQKKLDILGSLYYQNNNLLRIPKINLFIGKNQLFFKGCIGHTYNIDSSIYASNLNYFIPSLTGQIKAKAKLYGNYIFSILTGKFFASNLHVDNLNIKDVKISTNINMQDITSGKIFLYAKKINFYNTYINYLHIKINLHDKNQNCDFLLKSKNFYMHFIIHGKFNKEEKIWHGLLKTMNIKTLFGEYHLRKKFSVNYNINYFIDYIYKKNIQRINILSFIKYNKKLFFCNIFSKPLIKFKSNLFIKGYLKSFLGDKISNGKIFLIGSNIQAEKNQNNKTFLEKIDFLKISVNLFENNLKAKWIVKKINASLKNGMIFGYFNILNFYKNKNINGKCYIINFPISLLNFIISNNNTINGIFNSKIKFFGTIYQPKILADIDVKDIYIRTNNTLKYLSILFPHFLKKIKFIKIYQEILIKKGKILFKLHPLFKNSHSNLSWYLSVNSDQIFIFIFPKIPIKFSTHLSLYYLLTRYNLTGFIKLPFLYFKINEKNLVF